MRNGLLASCVLLAGCFSASKDFPNVNPNDPEGVCANGARDGDESDVDCGGSCHPCADLARCASPADCQSGSCEGDVCVSCGDGVQDQDEIAVDCGGSCPACPSPRNPRVTSLSPVELCSGSDATLTIMGADLDPESVALVSGSGSVQATSVSGQGAQVEAAFPAGWLAASATPYDLAYHDTSGATLTLPAAVTVFSSTATLSTVDPPSTYGLVDFPVRVHGWGLDTVTAMALQLGTTGASLTFVPSGVSMAETIVPAGLAPGSYDLVVTTAHGCTTTLAGAVVVRNETSVSVCAVDPPFAYNGIGTSVTIRSSADGSPSGAGCSNGTDPLVSTPRAWVSTGGSLVELENPAFVSAGAMRAVVPSGIPAAAVDLIVRDPDGTFGVLSGKLQVVARPPPTIDDVTPTFVGSTTTIAVRGTDFRAPASVYLVGADGTNAKATVTAQSTTEIAALVDPALLPYGTYLLRVTNEDDWTWGDFSALTTASPASLMGTWSDATSAPLVTATMRAGAAAAQVSPAERFLYVVGGDSGGATPTRFDTIQIAKLGAFGEVGPWRLGRNTLPEPRSMLALAAAPAPSGRGASLYAVGGDTASGATTKVSRAIVLLPDGAPSITGLDTAPGGTLAAGTWYYRVSAVMSPADPANPGGETLASAEATVHVLEGQLVTVRWTAVPGASGYRLYRSPDADGVSGDEVLLADDVSSGFVDAGAGVPGTLTPLEPGELGVWVDVSPLATPRRSAAVALAHDPTGAPFLYVLGGDQGSGFTTAVATADVHATYEYASLSADGATLGSWTLDGTNVLASRRTRLQAPVGESTTSPKLPAGVGYVYAVGGFDGNAVVQSYQAGTIATGGAITWSPATNAVQMRQGLVSIVDLDSLMFCGGMDAAGSAVSLGCWSAAYGTPPAFGFVNALSTSLPSPRALGALVSSSGHYYVIGGTTDGATAANTVSVAER